MPGQLALTYDDGPHPVWTPHILAALERHGAQATFFVQARSAVAHRDLIEATLGAGHEVGFHCLDHRRHSELGAEDVRADLEHGLDLLDRVGVRPRSWRAPWGDETDATRRLAAEAALRLWGWNIDTHDWRGDGARDMLAALVAQGGLRDGDVVLMHDALGPGARRDGCEETVCLTEALLERSAGAGLTTASVSECEGVLA